MKRLLRSLLLSISAVVAVRVLARLRGQDSDRTAMPHKYSSTDEVTLLGAMYQAERSDTGAIFTNTLAIVGFLITYVVAVMGFVTTAANPNETLLAFLPTPACALLAFHQVMVGMNGARAASALRLERKMAAIIDDPSLVVAKLDAQKRGLTRQKIQEGDPTFGILVGEHFLDPGTAGIGRAAGSVVIYGTLLVSVIGFTVFILKRALEGGVSTWLFYIGSTLAGVCLLVAVWNFGLNIRRPEARRLMKVTTQR